jgi:sRNA-binding carbon storage regulator CsrA
MFIISRRLGEQIVTGFCRVTVVKIDRDDVRLAIESPVDVPGSTIDPGLGKGCDAHGVGREAGKRPPAGVRYVSMRTGETVVIGSCRVTVVRTYAHLVRLGVKAPDDVVIRRDRREKREKFTNQ